MGIRYRKTRTPLFLALQIVGALLFVYWTSTQGVYAADWKQAIRPRKWVFPRDHGSHSEFRTEWWYFTGNLRDESDKRFGYQLTFFRQGVLPEAKNPTNSWSLRDLYLAHFTLTDASGNQFWHAERLSRKGPGLAGASEEGMDVWLLNWSATMKGEKIRLEARQEDMELSLELTTRKPIVFHGERGLSRKGPKVGQASYYFSYTDLGTQGSMRLPASPSRIRVTGTSWFDHEFGSNQLASDQVGWDWFSLHLSNGQDLMIYFLRRKDGSIEPTSSGTLVDTVGRGANLTFSEISLEVLDYWKSPKSGGRYPNRWKIRVPRSQLELLINPIVTDQELITKGSTGVTYWEGAVEGAGNSAGRKVTCEGYVELTGYAGTLGGLF